MQFPKECPNCKGSFESYYPGDERFHAYLIHRGELDWDSDEPHRIDDQVMECSRCHTLFRLRWELKSFHQLKELENNPKEGEKTE